MFHLMIWMEIFPQLFQICLVFESTPPHLSFSYGERATADQTVQPTNDPQPAAAMTDGVLGNLKERNGEPRVLEVELTASLNCRVQELDSNGGGEGGSGQAVRVHCTDERRGRRASRVEEDSVGGMVKE